MNQERYNYAIHSILWKRRRMRSRRRKKEECAAGLKKFSKYIC
jgi:hypothetical protein